MTSIPSPWNIAHIARTTIASANSLIRIIYDGRILPGNVRFGYHRGVNLKASASVNFGDFARIEELIVPKLIEGAQAGAQVVYQESQLRVPVDTGELKASGGTSVEWTGKRVNGYVEYAAGHAAYVEFGTGIRGASSSGAGPFPYSTSWPGQVAQPYLRTALDISRDRILDAFKDALGTIV